MKKTALLLIVLLAVFLLCACSDNSPVDGQETTRTDDKVIAEGDNFSVYELTGDDGVVKYRYEVLANDGTVIEQALCAEQPMVAQVNSKMVGIRFSAEGHVFVRYYDVERGLASKSFKNAFWDNGKLVATHDYDNGHYFLVQDIFDENGFSGTVSIECSTWQITVIAAEESADGSRLSVEYLPGDGTANGVSRSTVSLPLK